MTSSSRKPPQVMSLVIPIYNEEEVLPLLIIRLEALCRRIPCGVEILLIDDGSRDGSVAIMRDWAGRNDAVRVLELSRNFGHQAAVSAGMDYARGDVVVAMDGDLQDPPELILDMLAEYQAGYDVVYARRGRRDGETLFKRWSAALFYRVMEKFVSPDLPRDVGDFRLMSQEVVRAVAAMRERHRFVRGLVAWVGFRQKAVIYDRPARAAGETKYPLRRMLSLALDAILSFSARPLRLAVYAGLALFTLALVLGVYVVVRSLSGGFETAGWSTLVVLQCGTGGMTLLCMGMVGEYIGRIYQEQKNRPLYIVRAPTSSQSVSAATARWTQAAEPSWTTEDTTLAAPTESAHP